MNVNIGYIIREQYLQPPGITEEDVRDAVFHEDIKKIIRLDQDLNVIYFLKKKGNYYLLVDGRWLSPNLSISAVFKILPNTIEEIGINNPLTVLQKLAEECGYEIEIGDQRSKFIFDATISIPKIYSEAQYNQVMSQLVKVHDLERGSDDVVIRDHLAKWRQGENYDRIDIAFAYAISTNKYLQYLGSQ